MYSIFEALLKERGIRVADVVRATGIGQSTFSDWKRGKSVPKTGTMQKIAEFFGVSVAYLMGKVDAPESAPAYYFDDDARELARFLHENPEYKTLFKASRKIKKEDLEIVRQIIERFS